ncbi:MAG: hypothetical protein ACW96U_09685, partial [Candidatus Heimdallarchaeaceae archaeon]
MTEDDSSSRKRRILRFIRDLDLRYIRGSIDRRTYQTLKSKYQEMLTSLPQTLRIAQEVKIIEETKESLPELESDIQQIESGKEITTPAPQPTIDVEIPSIELPSIPAIEIEELKIRYVMHMAIKAATKTFEEEMDLEQDIILGRISDQDYVGAKNDIERKQHKIFQHFYKLSELLFSVCRDHLYKNTHNNFLLFNNEVSENINRLRRMETEKKELKGIIYDINDRVLRHRPILKKAAQDTLDWKVSIQQEKERFKQFYDVNESTLNQNQKDELERKIKQLVIYEELLDDDINDYTKDLDAMNAIYGEHLRYQEIITPYFKDLSLEAEDRIQSYSELMSSLGERTKISVSSNFASRDINYQLLSELKSLWRYTGKPVLDEQNDLIGFLVGPGQLDEQFGIIIKQQQEISLSMARRIYDNILPDRKDKKEELPEEEKKEYLLNEIIKNLPQVPFTFLIPEAIIEYCSRTESPISDELKQVMLQPDNFLFSPIEFVTKSSREIIIKSENIIQTGEILPYFNPTESNMINDHLSANTIVEVKDIFGNKIGKAHSVIYHPDKGYFIVTENEFVDDFIYEQIYKLLHGEIVPAPERAKSLTRREMKEATLD